MADEEVACKKPCYKICLLVLLMTYMYFTSLFSKIETIWGKESNRDAKSKKYLMVTGTEVSLHLTPKTMGTNLAHGCVALWLAHLT